jgi:hypothetical protein
MNIIKLLKESWGWTGLEPKEIVGENDFGNLIIKDVQNKYWRLCPEDFYCEVIAETKEELDSLSKDQEFLHDWYMQSLVEQAKEKFGVLTKDKKYYFVIPCILGGKYDISNIKSTKLTEIIALSGDIGQQIKDLPDGAQVKLSVTN